MRLADLGLQNSRVYDVVFSPDGKQLAAGTGDGQVEIWHVSSAQLVATLENKIRAQGLAFSPDGRVLAVGKRGGVGLWDTTDWTESGMLTSEAFQERSAMSSVAFSPDGTLLAAGGAVDVRKEAVTVWDVATGKPIMAFRDNPTVIWSIAFSPDGKRIATARWDGTVAICDVERGEIETRLDSNADVVFSVAFSPDGRFFAIGTPESPVQLFDTEDWTERALFGESHGKSLAFSPNGRLLATGGSTKVEANRGPLAEVLIWRRRIE